MLKHSLGFIFLALSVFILFFSFTSMFVYLNFDSIMSNIRIGVIKAVNVSIIYELCNKGFIPPEEKYMCSLTTNQLQEEIGDKVYISSVLPSLMKIKEQMLSFLIILFIASLITVMVLLTLLTRVYFSPTYVKMSFLLSLAITTIFIYLLFSEILFSSYELGNSLEVSIIEGFLLTAVSIYVIYSSVVANED